MRARLDEMDIDLMEEQNDRDTQYLTVVMAIKECGIGIFMVAPSGSGGPNIKTAGNETMTRFRALVNAARMPGMANAVQGGKILWLSTLS